MTTSHGYQFRSFSEADFPLIREWLAKPHVVEWWGDTESNSRLWAATSPSRPWRNSSCRRMGRPFGYLQSYDLAAWPDDSFGAQPRRNARDRPVHRRAGHDRPRAWLRLHTAPSWSVSLPPGCRA
jgi:hypothetical protein